MGRSAQSADVLGVDDFIQANPKGGGAIVDRVQPIYFRRMYRTGFQDVSAILFAIHFLSFLRAGASNRGHRTLGEAGSTKGC